VSRTGKQYAAAQENGRIQDKSMHDVLHAGTTLNHAGASRYGLL
jgi:hypothetical protein